MKTSRRRCFGRLSLISLFAATVCLSYPAQAETVKLWGKTTPSGVEGNTITLKNPATIVGIEGDALEYCIWRVEPGGQDVSVPQIPDHTDGQPTGDGPPDSTGSTPGQQSISLAGNWLGIVHRHIVSIAQNGQELTVIPTGNKGFVGWKRATGVLKKDIVHMSFDDIKLTGTITPKGDKISWSNNSIWIRQRSTADTAPTDEPATKCGLGTRWDDETAGWKGVWVRRGQSNVFDANWTRGSLTEKAVLTVNIHGNTVDVQRRQVAGGSHLGQGCVSHGTVAADKVTVTGTVSCDWSPGPHNWRSTIRCDDTIDSDPNNGIEFPPDSEPPHGNGSGTPDPITHGQNEPSGGLSPIADSHVYSYDYRNWNKANWGKYNILGAGWHPQGGEKRTFLKFDLAGLNANSISRVRLKLFHYHTGGGNNRLNLGVYGITQPWREGKDTYHSGQMEKTAAPGEISWVNQPSFNFDPIAQFNPGPGTNKFVEVDITPLVMAWLTGKPNYGLVIKPVGIMSGRAAETQYGFRSREFDETEKRPALVLSGAGSTGQPGEPGGGLGGDVIDDDDWTSTQQPDSKSTFSCENKDNEENGCCCFKGAHTYRFGSRPVTNVLARFDTGRTVNCRSTVSLDVDHGNGWETVQSIQANSSREGSEVAPTDVLVPINGAIEGFRISDGCVCCIDASEISLNAGSSGGGLGGDVIDGETVGVSRWWHSIDKDWITLADGEISDSQMHSWGYTKKQFQFFGSKAKTLNSVAVHRWWHSADKDWISLADGEISDSQMHSWGYAKKQFQFFGSKAKTPNSVAVHRWWHSADKDWISIADGEISDSQMHALGYAKKKLQFYSWQSGKPGGGSGAGIGTGIGSGTGSGSSETQKCGLGMRWDEVEVSGWTGVWTRRGASNVFDAHWTLGGKQDRATLKISMQGNTVNINRQQTDSGSSNPGQECRYKGTLAADNVTVTGSYGCDWAAGPYNWRATISCNSGGSGIGTGTGVGGGTGGGSTSSGSSSSGPSISSDSSNGGFSASTKEHYSWADWELICPQPWKLVESTGPTIIGTRKLYRCAYRGLSAILRAVETRKDGTPGSDSYNVVFFYDTNNPQSLTSRNVRDLLFGANGNPGSETLKDIYLNATKNRWESVNRQYVRWTSTGSKDEELNYFNLQHHSGIWDAPVKTHSKWYPNGALSYEKKYEAVEDPDHWRSVVVSSVSYGPDKRISKRYKDFVIRQNSDGYWNSFATHVMTWAGNPSFKNGEFFYKVVQQPSGVWTSFEMKYLTYSKNGDARIERLHEIYFEATCNCYKSKRI